MKLRYFTIFIFCFIEITSVVGQKEWNIWYFGKKAGIDFNFSPPKILTDGQINTREGSTVFCDKITGELLFYSDGTKVWNKNHEIMDNGDNLKGDYSSTQSAIAVPFPGHENQFYLFTAATITTDNSYYYSIINMESNNNLGRIISNKKNIVLSENGSEKLIAAKHCNGIDYWVVTHGLDDNIFNIYTLTQEGITLENTYSLGKASSSTGWSGIGYIKFSRDSRKLVCVFGPDSNGLNGVVDIYDFDSETGEISNLLSIYNLERPVASEFSPNGRFLYISTADYKKTNALSGVYQFDLTQTDIVSSKIPLFEEYGINFGAIQLAPNNKIFIAKELGYNISTPFLDCITLPNNKGLLSSYVEKYLDLQTGEALFGLPTFISNFNYNPPFGKIEQTLCTDESIIINGNTYDINTPKGFEYLTNQAQSGCDSIVIIDLEFDGKITKITDSLCIGSSIVIEGETFFNENSSGQITIPLQNNNCDSILDINLTFGNFPVHSDFTTTICLDDTVNIDGSLFYTGHSKGQVIISNGSAFGCDSIINVVVNFLPYSQENFSQSFCPNDSVEINGTIYNAVNPAGLELIPNGSASGCDSLVIIDLSFNGVFSFVEDYICKADTYSINGTIYDINNPTGTEVFINGSLSGCDSTVFIDLRFYEDEAFVEVDLCNHEAIFEFENQVFDIQSPKGILVLPNASFLGCDSIINIQVNYHLDTLNYQDTLCWYDTIIINDKIYFQGNQSGLEFTIDNQGCDLFYNIDLYFPYQDVYLDLLVPDTVCYGDIAHFEAQSNLINPNYFWYKNGIEIANGTNIIEHPVTRGDIFSVETIDDFGCILIEKNITIETKIDYSVYFPNAITPNSDGINDVFTVFGSRKIKQVQLLQIYDRWGNMVFQNTNFITNDYNFGWDGTINREKSNLGVYVYYAIIEFIDDTTQEFYGDFTLLKN